LALAKCQNGFVIGGTFHAAVPGLIVVGGHRGFFFAIGFVMLLVVRDDVVQGEPVMRRDEIDARPRAGALTGKLSGDAQK